jgi:hypothetical protein
MFIVVALLTLIDNAPELGNVVTIVHVGVAPSTVTGLAPLFVMPEVLTPADEIEAIRPWVAKLFEAW